MLVCSFSLTDISTIIVLTILQSMIIRSWGCRKRAIFKWYSSKSHVIYCFGATLHIDMYYTILYFALNVLMIENALQNGNKNRHRTESIC